MARSGCFRLVGLVILITGLVVALPRNERTKEEQGGRNEDQNDLNLEENYRKIAYDLEVILQQYLRTWNFLTETKSVFDEGEVIDKNWFIAYDDVDIPHLRGDISFPFNKSVIVNEVENRDDNTVITCNNFDTQNTHSKKWKCKVRVQKNTIAWNKTVKERYPTIDVKERKSVILRDDEPSLNEQRHAEGKKLRKRSGELKRTERSAGIPVMYMPGEKKKRQCVAAGGIFSGYNALSYLSFITGILSLILNVNNNINNNNNNNNLNDNNDISNNNVDANSNSQTANQIVVFPPGRKRRSFADWLLQSVNLYASTAKSGDVKKLATDDREKSTNSASHHIIDGMTKGLRLMVSAILNNIDSTLKRNGYDITKGVSDGMNPNIRKEN
ncbi:uncharacterized protein [Palaemon carinicauda]|uniref:uncharacterized protein isoform X1 n=1 Tax=Palaemon carinicauda TaxID=392227 RepID=UPI0035B595C5